MTSSEQMHSLVSKAKIQPSICHKQKYMCNSTSQSIFSYLSVLSLLLILPDVDTADPLNFNPLILNQIYYEQKLDVCSMY